MKKSIPPFTLLALVLAALLPLGSMATKHIVNVQNFSFSPANITNVQVGDTMRWVWIGGSHTTTSSVVPSGASTWNSPITSTVTSYEYKVLVAGTYNYVCTPHAGMGMVGSFTALAGPTLLVSPANRDVSATAGNTTFSVTSNSNWTAISNQPWCTVTPSGFGSGTITASYTANPGTTTRVAIITVTVSGLPAQSVTVTQAGAAATLTVTPSNRDVTAQTGATSFSVTSNSGWTVSSNQSWCSVTPSGSGNGTIDADYTENTVVEPRVATITVTVAGLPAQAVTVTQAGADPVLLVSPSNQDVSADAGSAIFTITSNTNWIAQSNAEWCMVTSDGTGNSTATADYAENTTYETRVAELVISVPNLPPQTVTVTQDASTVSVKKVTLPAFQVFPNPAKDHFSVNLQGLAGSNAILSIISLDGSVVLEKSIVAGSETPINVSGTPSGTYVVSVISGEMTNTQHLVIVH